MPTVSATASLSGTGTLRATAMGGPDLASLWNAYMAAALNAAQLRSNWKMIRPAVYADGTSGTLYAQLFEAEAAADAAHLTWEKAYRVWYPGPPS